MDAGSIPAASTNFTYTAGVERPADILAAPAGVAPASPRRPRLLDPFPVSILLALIFTAAGLVELLTRGGVPVGYREDGVALIVLTVASALTLAALWWSPLVSLAAALLLLVVQALAATGKLADAAFTDKSATPQAALVGFQLTCAQPAADRGALTYPGSANAANSFATAQGVPALAGRAFPLSAQTLTAGVPAVPCEVATTTTTTSSTTTTTSTTTTAAASDQDAPAASVLGVQAESAPSGQLADTGSSSIGTALAGATLLLLGLGLSILSVRRR